MKRTKAYIIGTPTFKRDEVAHDLHYIGGVKYSLNGSIVNLFHSEHKISKIEKYFLPLPTEFTGVVRMAP